MSHLLELPAYDGREIRTEIDHDGSAWFCGKDICDILGYANSTDALNAHCSNDGVAKRYLIDSMGRRQEATFISEPNLYRLVCGSNLETAKKFEVWVFETILPSIRKTGGYTLPSSSGVDAATVNTDGGTLTISAAKYIELLESSNANLQSKLLSLSNQSALAKARIPCPRPKRTPLSQKTKDQIIKLMKEGWSNPQIAYMVHVPTKDFRHFRYYANHHPVKDKKIANCPFGCENHNSKENS